MKINLFHPTNTTFSFVGIFFELPKIFLYIVGFDYVNKGLCCGLPRTTHLHSQHLSDMGYKSYYEKLIELCTNLFRFNLHCKQYGDNR